MKKILDKIFKLPPVMERRDIKHGWFLKIFTTTEPTRHKDDSYLHYQAGYVSTVICLITAAFCLYVYMTHRSVNLYFYTISFSEGDHAMRIFEQYEDITFVLLLSVTIFFLIKMRWNIDPARYNVFWRRINNFYKINSGRKWVNRLIKIHAMWGILMALIVMRAPAEFWAMVHKYWEWPDTIFSVSIIFLWSVWAGGWVPTLALLGITWLWHMWGRTEQNNAFSRRK